MDAAAIPGPLADVSAFFSTLQGVLVFFFMLAAFWLLFSNMGRISERIGTLTGLKVAGVEMQFAAARTSMREAVYRVGGLTKTYKPAHPVYIPKRDARRALNRADENRAAFQNRMILWVDDRPENNDAERHVFESYGARVVFATSNMKAIAMITAAPARYDLVISDIARDEFVASTPGQEPATDFVKRTTLSGLELPGEIRKLTEPPADPGDRVVIANPPPLIFYVGTLLPGAQVPDGALALTNRPDRLLDLAVDVFSDLHKHETDF